MLPPDTTRPSSARAAPRGGPAPAPPRSTTRLLQVDCWRGVAILFIFINHLPTNPLQPWTVAPHGFSDTAVWFFFLSGFVARLVYHRVVRDQGLVAAARKIGRRLLELYACHLFLSLVFIGAAWSSGHGPGPEIWPTNPAAQLASRAPLEAFVATLTLQLGGFCLDILPAYLVLLVIFLGTTVLERRFRVPPMVVALGLFGLNYVFRRQFFASWAFNPLSWQFLFHLGGWVYDRRERLISGGWRTGFILALAWATLLACALFRHAPTLLPPDWAARLALFAPLVNKKVLNAPYLFHGLIALFALGCLVSNATIARIAPLRGLALLGRKPLPLFVLTTALCLVVYRLHGHSLSLFATGAYLALGLGLGTAHLRLTAPRP